MSPDLMIRYRITEDEYVQALRTHFRYCGKMGWPRRYIYPVLWVLLSLVALTIGTLQYLHGEDWSGQVPIFLLACVFLALHLCRNAWFRRQYHKDKRFQDSIELRISGDTVSFSNAASSTHHKHGAFVRCVETADFFLLYSSPLGFNVIPKRDLSPEQQNELVAFLDQELPVRKGVNHLPLQTP